MEERKTITTYHIKFGLLDSVTNTFVKADTWIATEIDRLTRGQQPRNCLNYESLLFVVEKINSLDTVSSLVYHHRHQHQYHHQHNHESSNSPRTKIQFRDSVSIPRKDIKSNFDNTINKTFTTVNKNLLTQRSLIHSYMKLIAYCHQDIPPHYRRPIELLIELEKMSESNRDISHIRENLSGIVFGKQIPISRNLVSAWTVICLWVQQGCSSVSEESWFSFGITAYLIAKRLSRIVK